jgi:uncharacterized membrane protein YtjA (UPF0391 family)
MVAIIAAVLGGIADTAAWIAKVCFVPGLYSLFIHQEVQMRVGMTLPTINYPPNEHL